MNASAKYISDPSELKEFSQVSWQVIIYVTVGIGIALGFDYFNINGYLPEGIVRAIAGTADTMGLALAALVTQVILILRTHFRWARKIVPDWGTPNAVTWIIGGFIGLGVAFSVQALVFYFASDPHGLIGVSYAFAFSNLDNTIAGLTVLLASVLNQGKQGFRQYWHHPFYYGNAIMLITIPTVAVIFRLLTNFRPETNIAAGIESGLMDMDSIGAAVIFLVATKVFHQPVPKVDDDLSDALGKLIQK